MLSSMSGTRPCSGLSLCYCVRASLGCSWQCTTPEPQCTTCSMCTGVHAACPNTVKRVHRPCRHAMRCRTPPCRTPAGAGVLGCLAEHTPLAASPSTLDRSPCRLRSGPSRPGGARALSPSLWCRAPPRLHAHSVQACEGTGDGTTARARRPAPVLHAPWRSYAGDSERTMRKREAEISVPPAARPNCPVQEVACHGSFCASRLDHRAIETHCTLAEPTLHRQGSVNPWRAAQIVRSQPSLHAPLSGTA